jgi:hypothetical protein
MHRFQKLNERTRPGRPISRRVAGDVSRRRLIGGWNARTDVRGYKPIVSRRNRSKPAPAIARHDLPQQRNFLHPAANQFAVRATNCLSLAVNAGYTKTVAVGERYRDNALVAWASVDATGSIKNTSASFGISDISRIVTGTYRITTTASAFPNGFYLLPVVIAELDSAPSSAAGVRLVSVNQVLATVFEVYVNDGTFAPKDNDFIVMVTGR